MRSIKDQDTNKNVLVIKLNQFQSCQGNQAVNSIISRLTTDRIIATITEILSTWLRFRPCFEDNFLFADNQLLFFTRQFLRNLPQKNAARRKKQFVRTFPRTGCVQKVWKSMESATPSLSQQISYTLKSVSRKCFETRPVDAVSVQVNKTLSDEIHLSPPFAHISFSTNRTCC